MSQNFNRLHTLTGHDQTKAHTEAELMELRRDNRPEVRTMGRIALGLRGEMAKRKAKPKA